MLLNLITVGDFAQMSKVKRRAKYLHSLCYSIQGVHTGTLTIVNVLWVQIYELNYHRSDTDTKLVSCEHEISIMRTPLKQEICLN